MAVLQWGEGMGPDEGGRQTDSGQTGGQADRGAAVVWGRPSFGSVFDPRHNSLNFLRLLLATLVIVDHADSVGYLRVFPLIGNAALGTVAVFGFFGISGFLIAGSASRNRIDHYFWQRFLRIFPAFWVCLIVTAFVFGPMFWLHTSAALHRHGGLAAYVNTPTGPFHYLYHDALLRMNQNSISGTPVEFGVWNASLWTLFYEFMCYIVLGGLAVIGLLKRPVLVVWLTVAVVATEVAFAVPQVHLNFDEGKLLSFVPIFLVGALIYLYRHRIPDSGVLALMSMGLFLVGCWVPLGGPALVFTGVNNGPALFAPFLAYPVLWLGVHLPLQKVGSRNDYSYGMYIFAFPIQILLVTWGLNRWGDAVFTGLSIVATIPAAVASWWIIERNALKLKAHGPIELVGPLFHSRNREEGAVPTPPDRSGPSDGTGASIRTVIAARSGGEPLEAAPGLESTQAMVPATDDDPASAGPS